MFWVSWVLRVPGLGLVSPGPKVGKCQARRGKGHCHEEYTDEAQDSSHHLFVVSGGLWGMELATLTPKPLNQEKSLNPTPRAAQCYSIASSWHGGCPFTGVEILRPALTIPTTTRVPKP